MEMVYALGQPDGTGKKLKFFVSYIVAHYIHSENCGMQVDLRLMISVLDKPNLLFLNSLHDLAVFVNFLVSVNISLSQ